MRRLLLLAFGLLLAPVAASAQAPRELVEIRQGEPLQIRPDRAYFLIRIGRPQGVAKFDPVFLRIPTAAEMAGWEAARRDAFARAAPELIRQREQQLAQNRLTPAERHGRPVPVDPVPSVDAFRFDYGAVANLNRIDANRALVPGRPEATYLVEAVPGEYVLYGISFGMWTPAVHTCLCLGTIGFSAQPGVVFDLGTFFADKIDKVSDIPELRAESGYGPSMNGFLWTFGAAIRPATAETARPPLPAGAIVRPAVYHAVGKFLEPQAMSINRLPPIPGVLAYDGGRVIDVRSGQAVPDMIDR
jgi:hypothetical protein